MYIYIYVWGMCAKNLVFKEIYNLQKEDGYNRKGNV